ncbi:discoidin domain-containing protein [Cohnella soli]|uniref:Discoidin domain-containing protein n=1 Tax=Cohnella soli TaxID=425005 RepID=A0ABW0HT72_9BACL
MRKQFKSLLAVSLLASSFVFVKPSNASAAAEDFQIGIFWPPASAYSNATQFDYIRDAHINLIHNVDSTDLDTVAENVNMLNLASTRGIAVSVADSRSTALDSATNAQIDAIANDYKSHSATHGYYVKDEPVPSQFAGFARAYNRFLYNHPSSEPYVNMLPTYFGFADYPAYLNQWVETVGASNLKTLAFDNYPWKAAAGSFGADYFQNLEYIRHAGLKYNVHTGSYLQSVGIPNSLRRPNANELRYNAYTNVAYGIKELYWFTWWTPTGRSEPFTNAIIDPNGNKTDLYVPVQTINGEIEKLGPTLVKLTSQSVYHNGVMASGTVPIPNNFFWKPADASANVMISHFKHSNGRHYVMVVNRTLTDTLTLSFNVNPKPSTVTEVSKSTGLGVATNYNATTGTISSNFAPGEGRLYALPAGFDPEYNLALNRSVSSSSSVEAYGWSKSALVDGQTGTVTGSAGWSSSNSLATNHTEWVTIDLGGLNVVNEIRMFPRNDAVNAGYGFPVDFQVQVSSDNTNWTPVVTRTGYANPGGAVQTFTFGRQAARYVRVNGTSLRANPNESNNYRMQFAEIQLYHNTSETATTGLFSDDFSGDLSKWVYTDSSAIQNGEFRVTANERIRNAKGGYDWTNYAFESDVKITKSAVGLVFRSTDDNNFYMWQVTAAGKLRPHKKVNGVWTLIKEVNAGFVANTAYNVKIEAVGSTIKTYVNGTLVDTTTDTTFSRGNIGFRVDTAVEEGIIDNVKVSAL